MVTNEHLQSIIDGKIGVIDSTQAVAVARELLAARKFLVGYEESFKHELAEEFRMESDLLAAWRKAAE